MDCKTLFSNTISKIISENKLSSIDMSENEYDIITDKDYVAYEISSNNILMNPQKYDRHYFFNNDLRNSLHPDYFKALRIIKIPKGSKIMKKKLYYSINVSNKIYVGHRLSPLTYPEGILIENQDGYNHIIPDLDKAIDVITEIDVSGTI